MSTIESQAEPVGNTKTTGNKTRKPQDIQCYRWQFTLKFNGEPEEPKILFDTLKEFCKEFYFQLEKGNSGYEHFQGCLSLKNKERLSTVKNIIRNDAHIESAKDWHALKKYSTKKDSRVSGPWDHNSVWIDLIKDEELYEWQKKIIEKIKEKPDNRTINWIWEPTGKFGKTQFQKYLIVKFGASLIGGGKKDIAYSLPDDPKIVVMNLERDLEERVNYGAIEAVKDGLIFSGKYESKVKIFNSPHVLIFANFEPDIERMSKDRWSIVRL